MAHSLHYEVCLNVIIYHLLIISAINIFLSLHIALLYSYIDVAHHPRHFDFKYFPCLVSCEPLGAIYEFSQK